jgi:hypothetical protein
MDDIYEILESGEENLLAMNTALTRKVAELIGIETPVELSGKEFIMPGSEILAKGGISDFRDSIHPKRESNLLERLQLNKPYWQVFTNKQGFVPNLTILDLLFNEGPNAISYLESVSYR